MPIVADIANGSWVDGPGMRTVVFLRGCPLGCLWCHNPEMQAAGPEREGDRRLPAERLASILSRDRAFFDSTGGGVTFSGGEPLLYIDYVADVCSRLKAAGIHIAIETAGLFSLRDYCEKLEPLVDLLLFDVKIIDPQEHRRWTGSDNAPILQNLAALARRGAPLRLRVPLVPGITATCTNLRAIARLRDRWRIPSVELLPYNPSGFDKARQSAGRFIDLPPALRQPMSRPEEEQWRRFFHEAGSQQESTGC